MVRTLRLLSLLVSLVLLLAGCWDQVEIEERGFVIGSGVDVADDDDDKQELTLTHQFVVPEGIGTPADEGGDEPAYDNLTTTGDSAFEISRKMTEQTSKIPFYEHEKVIVVSKDIVKQPHLFGKVLDLFIRNPEMRRSMKVVIADGKAQDILDTKPDSEDIPIAYLDDLMEKSSANASEMEPVTIGTIHQKLLDDTNYVLPRIIPEEKSVKSKGAAVFRGYNDQMAGFLDSQETKGLNLLTGQAEGGVIKTAMEQKNITYEMENVSNDIKLDTSDPNDMHVHMTVNVSGTISESFGTQNLFEEMRLKEIEKHVSDKIKKIAGQTIEKAQNDLKTDVFGIDERLKEQHYGTWKQIKDNWDHGANYFSDVTFHVDASTRIRTTGNVNKVKNS